MRWPVTRQLALIPLALVAAAAVTMAGCGPAIDAAAKADVDRMAAAVAPRAKIIPASTANTTAALTPGQWSRYLVTRGGKPSSFVTFEVVGLEADAVLIETDSVSYGGRAHTKVLLRMVRQGGTEVVDVRRFSIRAKDGRMVEQPQSALALMRPALERAFSRLFTDWRGSFQESVTVAPGTFEGCFRRREVTDWGHVHGTSDSWFHPAVPIFGLVRSKGIEQPYVQELVAFGLNRSLAAPAAVK